MIDINDCLGLPLIALETSELIGTVTHFLTDPVQNRVIGLASTDKDRWFEEKKALLFNDVVAFGVDAVIARSVEAVRPITQVQEVQPFLDNGAPKRVRQAVSRTGQNLGTITDWSFNEETAEISRLRLEPPGGGEALIARPAVTRSSKTVVILEGVSLPPGGGAPITGAPGAGGAGGMTGGVSGGGFGGPTGHAAPTDQPSASAPSVPSNVIIAQNTAAQNASAQSATQQSVATPPEPAPQAPAASTTAPPQQGEPQVSAYAPPAQAAPAYTPPQPSYAPQQPAVEEIIPSSADRFAAAAEAPQNQAAVTEASVAPQETNSNIQETLAAPQEPRQPTQPIYAEPEVRQPETAPADTTTAQQASPIQESPALLHDAAPSPTPASPAVIEETEPSAPAGVTPGYGLEQARQEDEEMIPASASDVAYDFHPTLASTPSVEVEQATQAPTQDEQEDDDIMIGAAPLAVAEPTLDEEDEDLLIPAAATLEVETPELEEESIGEAEEGAHSVSEPLKEAINRNKGSIIPFLIEKYSNENIYDEQGNLIIARGQQITEELAETAHQAHRLYELWIAAQTSPAG